jgi:hypothetical protein
MVAGHPSGFGPALFNFWFLEIAEEVESLDEFFLRDFMLIMLPLLLYFCVEGVLSASTAHCLLQCC